MTLKTPASNTARRDITNILCIKFEIVIVRMIINQKIVARFPFSCQDFGTQFNG